MGTFLFSTSPNNWTTMDVSSSKDSADQQASKSGLAVSEADKLFHSHRHNKVQCLISKSNMTSIMLKTA